MTGSHIDTVATGGRFDGNLGVLAGLEVIETLEQHGVATVTRSAVAFFTDEEGARFAPDMLGSLVYVGGMAVEEALDVARRRRRGPPRRRAGAHRLRRPVAVPHCAAPARLRRAAHRARPDPRGRGRHDRRGRGGAGHLVDGADDHRSVGARRHDADAPAARPRVRRRRDRDVRARRSGARQLGGAQVATVGRIDVRPEPGQRRAQLGCTLTVDLRNTDDARVARRPSAPRRRGRSARRRRGCDGRRPGRWPASSRSTSTRRRSTSSSDRAAPRALDPADAERRRPRRPDARPGVPDGDDLHAQRRRPLPQHRRAHRPRRRHGWRGRPPADRADARHTPPSRRRRRSDRLAERARRHGDEVGRLADRDRPRGPVDTSPRPRQG